MDDENSQAEGTIEGAVGVVRPDQQQQQQQQANNPNQQQQQQNVHPHYENIYESIEHYNAAARGLGAEALIAPINPNNNANAPAEELIVPPPTPQQPHPPATTQASATGNPDNNNTQSKSRLTTSNINYRNDLYDRANGINGSATTNGIGVGAGSTNYDIPRSVRSGLGFRRNFQLDLHAGLFYENV